MEALKILVVDDESRMRKLVKDFLTKKGFQVLEAGDGEEAMDLFYKEKDIALILLDVMMPRMDGWEVCREIRKNSKVPIIMLTAKGDTIDKVLGLDLGADDYMVKPFLPKELLFRIMAILRRCYKDENPLVQLQNSQIDFARAEVIKSGMLIPLTAKEHRLLWALYRNAGCIVTIDALCEAV